MRLLPALLLSLASVAALFTASRALAREGWHRSPDDAVAASRTSGKPILLVTCWKDGV